MASINDCEGCKDSPMPGVRPDSTNHSLRELPKGFVVVERCDECRRHEDDVAAATAYGHDVMAWDGNRTSVTICKPGPFGTTPEGALELVADAERGSNSKENNARDAMFRASWFIAKAVRASPMTYDPKEAERIGDDLDDALAYAPDGAWCEALSGLKATLMALGRIK